MTRTIGVLLLCAVPVLLGPWAMIYVFVLIGRLGRLDDPASSSMKTLGPSLVDFKQRAGERFIARFSKPILVLAVGCSGVGLALIVLPG